MALLFFVDHKHAYILFVIAILSITLVFFLALSTPTAATVVVALVYFSRVLDGIPFGGRDRANEYHRGPSPSSRDSRGSSSSSSSFDAHRGNDDNNGYGGGSGYNRSPSDKTDELQMSEAEVMSTLCRGSNVLCRLLFFVRQFSPSRSRLSVFFVY